MKLIILLLNLYLKYIIVFSTDNHATKKEVRHLGQYIPGVVIAIVVGVCYLHHLPIAILSIEPITFY